MLPVLRFGGHPRIGFELREKLSCPHDGASNQLWKEGEVGREGQQVRGRLQCAAMHVKHITDGLKREKGQADGNQKMVKKELKFILE